MKWLMWISMVLVASCCDRPCGVQAWREYIVQEQAIRKEMDRLVPQHAFPLLSSYTERPAQMTRVPYAEPLKISPYRIARDARERRLLRVKRDFHRARLSLALEQCGCPYNREVEREAHGLDEAR